MQNLRSRGFLFRFASAFSSSFACFSAAFRAAFSAFSDSLRAALSAACCALRSRLRLSGDLGRGGGSSAAAGGGDGGDGEGDSKGWSAGMGMVIEGVSGFGDGVYGVWASDTGPGSGICDGARSRFCCWRSCSGSGIGSRSVISGSESES